ncbi:MAG: peptidylprolyl isomerase [Alphaproteobacteria bacterium]
MRVLFIPLIVAAFVATAGVGYGQNVLGIAAVVNDDVISMYDLMARTRLAIVSSGLEDTPEIRRRLAPQVLRSLIDEKLQLQEAKRLNIAIAEDEIAAAIARIEQENKVPAGSFDDFLVQNGIELSTIVSQIRAGIAWAKVIGREMGPTVQIGPDEIDEALARMEARQDISQNRVLEIFFAVDAPAQEEDIQRTAERLVEQVRKGASFTALAQQFSQSATAAVGGDMGWIQQGQLDDELDAVINEMQPGEVSEPIRTVSGYHILMLADRRATMTIDEEDTTVSLQEVFLSVAPDAGPDYLANMIDLANIIYETVSGCEDMKAVRAEIGEASLGLPDKVAVRDLAPKLRKVALSLELNQPSKPMILDNGVLIVMVCERVEPTGLPSREEIGEGLTRQRVDMLARRYMRDLRRAAFLDLRL